MDIKLRINDTEVTVREGATIMEAIQKLSFYVPHFCYHEKLSIAANCRMCMVDVEKSPKAVPACATPVVDGMVVYTESERAKKAQHGVMEFLLINHPLDCPICDQGGECQLQDLAVGYGLSRSRYQEEKRVVFEKNLGPLIATDMTRCIHCTRCVRFGREVAGIMELGMTGRGEHSEIMPFVERTVDSELSGNMIDLCPVGALTSKPFRYSARAWELRRHESIATHDSWGSHLTVQTKDNAVKRVLPSRAPGIHEHWISDRDRFSYEGLAAADRALAPMARDAQGKSLKELPWKDAISGAAQHLRDISAKHGADKIGFFISPRATCEEAHLMRRIADSLGCKNIDSRLQQRHFDGEDISGFGIPFGDILAADNILFVGAEPARELPLLAALLRQKGRRINLFSIAAQDDSDKLPYAEQLLVAPTAYAATLKNLLSVLNVDLPEECRAVGDKNRDLFSDDSSKIFARVRKITGHLAKSKAKGKGKNIIWLGDSARNAANYGAITALARHLATHLDAALGTLSDGGNGVGVRRAGALPPPDGMTTADMLRADLKAIVLLRCEQADFAEAALMKDMLKQAEFICAINSFSGGLITTLNSFLSAAEFSETDGSYVNGNGDISAAQAATPPPGKVRPAWKILRLLGEYLAAPGFDFNTLGEVTAALTPMLSDSARQTASRPLKHPGSGSGSGGDRNRNSNRGNSGGGGGSDEDEISYCLHGGVPTYGGDPLVRRSGSLQKTRQGKAAAIAALHPDDIKSGAIAQIASGDSSDSGNLGETGEGGRVILRDSEGNEEEATLAADPTLARSVVRFTPKKIKSMEGLEVLPVLPVPHEETA